ncbi:MAG: polyisoprenoid-binding protein [Desulfobulbaceae bacterium]|nr:polyisoprenoid-binding protein [Desulfobulbaceae bacterium]
MKKISVVVIICTCLFVGGQYAQAGVTEWKFDTVHSGIYFDIRHIHSTIRGHFRDYSGVFLFDLENPAAGKIKMEIKVKSIYTDNQKRDKHLRSNEFFDAGKYPVMTFESTTIKPAGDKQYLVAGKLTVKGLSKDISFPLTYLGEKEHPLQKDQFVAGFSSRLTIDRLDYQVGDGKFYKMGVVGKDVGITISLEMLRDK